MEAAKQEVTVDEILNALIPDDLSGLSYSELKKRKHAIEEKRAELAAKKKKLVGKQSDLKAGDHTEKSFQALQRVKGEIAEIEQDLARLKPQMARLCDLVHERRADKEEVDKQAKKKISELEDRVSELKDRLSSVSDEAADKGIEVKRLRKRLANHKSAREALRDLISELQPLMRVARDTEDKDDKSLYLSTTASLWLGDLHDIRDVATKAADALDR